MDDPLAGDEEHAGSTGRQQSHGEHLRQDAPATQRHQRLGRGLRRYTVRFNF